MKWMCSRYILDGELVTRGGNLWSISEMFLIDMEVVQEFVYFCEAIYEENLNSLLWLAYYEMMLWIRVNNEDKITELCDYIATNDDGDKPNFKSFKFSRSVLLLFSLFNEIFCYIFSQYCIEGHQPKLGSARTGLSLIYFFLYFLK